MLAIALLVSPAFAAQKAVRPLRPGDLPGYAAVPLVKGKENHLLLRGRIGHRDAELLLDTGAPVTCIDEPKRKLFELEPIGDRDRQPLQVVANGRPHSLTLIPRIRLGNTSIENTPAVLIDLTEQNRWAKAVRDFSIDGILGANELVGHAAILDCGAQRLYLETGARRQFDLEGLLLQAGYVELNLQIDHGHLIVPGTVNGTPARFIVDTGASITNLDRAFCLKHKIPLGRRKFISAGIHMRDTSSRLAHAYLRFGAFDTGDVIFGVSDISMLLSDANGPGKAPLVGLLGCEILEWSGAVIDFDQLKLYAWPNRGR